MGLYVEAVNVEGMPMSEEVHDSIMAGDILIIGSTFRCGRFHMMVSAIALVTWRGLIGYFILEAHRQNVEFEMMVPEETEIRADEIKKDLFEW